MNTIETRMVRRCMMPYVVNVAALIKVPFIPTENKQIYCRDCNHKKINIKNVIHGKHVGALCSTKKGGIPAMPKLKVVSKVLCKVQIAR
jgi:hypothetical protein